MAQNTTQALKKQSDGENVNNLKLLAFVPNLRNFVGADRTPEGQAKFFIDFGRELRRPYFEQGYVSIDLGRTSPLTDAIRQSTQGYALADENGHIVQTYRNLATAVKARDGAVIRVVPEVDVEEDVIPEAEAIASTNE